MTEDTCQAKETRKIAFICRACGEAIGDPAYCGPWGHAPQDVCFACWLNAFEQPPLHWPRQILMLWFLSNGWTKAEAAQRCGVRARTVTRWLIAMRTNLSQFFEMVSDLDGLCVYTSS